MEQLRELGRSEISGQALQPARSFGPQGCAIAASPPFPKFTCQRHLSRVPKAICASPAHLFVPMLHAWRELRDISVCRGGVHAIRWAHSFDWRSPAIASDTGRSCGGLAFQHGCALVSTHTAVSRTIGRWCLAARKRFRKSN